MAKYINVCDTDNNVAWTMDDDTLHDIVYGYSKQYIGDQVYKLAAIVPMITAYGADRDYEWYKAAEIDEEGDEWEYCIGEVEDAGIKELRCGPQDDPFGFVYWQLFIEKEEKEDMVSIALVAAHDVHVRTMTAYWFMKAYCNHILVEATRGDIVIDYYDVDRKKIEIVKLKKKDMDSTHILIGIKLSAHDLYYPSIKYFFAAPN